MTNADIGIVGDIGGFNGEGVIKGINPSNAEASFVQSIRTQRFLKTIQTLFCWYSFKSSR